MITQSRYAAVWVRALLGLSSALACLIALGMRFLNEDLFIALCSGRDTLGGLPGRPDQWSFTMPGAVWVDQSWLSHLLYYLSYLLGHEAGPVVLKAGLLPACMAILFLRCRALGVSPEVSLFAVSLGILSMAPFLQIRGENFGVLYFLLFTGLLTAPRSWGRKARLGALVVLALWCNSHGSFMLGLVLAAMWLLIDPAVRSAARLYPASGAVTGPQEPDFMGRLWVFIAALAVAALMNPYGPANLLMPFRQLSAGAVTNLSADWVPLAALHSILNTRLLYPLDGKPFLGMTALVLILLTARLIGRMGGSPAESPFPGRSRSEVLMEVLVPVVLVVLALRFRRMVLFAAPALVVPLAVLLEEYLKGRKGKYHAASVALAGIWAALLIAAFAVTTVPPYLPGNPMRPDRPLMNQLMSFDSYTPAVAHFMKDNAMGGRVFASWTAAAFLRFHYPGITVFMDARDQSFYSDDIIELYFRLLRSGPEDTGTVLETLDRFRTEYVALALNPADFALATRLMETKKWACLFADKEFILLARSDSERFGDMFRAGKLEELRYPDADTRVVSEAVLSVFFGAGASADRIEALKDLVHRKPESNLYGLTTMALNGRVPCLNRDSAHFLTSEAQFLAGRDYRVADGARTILKSLITVSQTLEEDAVRCRGARDAGRFAGVRYQAQRIYDALQWEYRGY